MGPLSISAVGATVTSGATASAAAAIPNGPNATRAKAVRVTASTLAYVKFGVAGVAATANDILVSTTPSVFWVGGQTHFSVIQETAGSKVNIVPVDM